MANLGFLYNMNTCVACGACQIACKTGHHLKSGEFLRRVDMMEEGPFSGSCNHCRDAACVSACPTGAMYKAEDGTTLHDDGKCIGCGACMWNCPYGAVSFSKTKGVAQKCDSCRDRRAQGLKPLCVDACPTKSIRFEELDETMADLPFLPDAQMTKPNLKVKPSKLCLSVASKDDIPRSDTALCSPADITGGGIDE